MGVGVNQLENGQWLEVLEREVVAGVVRRERDLRVLYSQDVLGKGAVALAVLRT